MRPNQAIVKRIFKQSKHLRFTRWSRKSYAAFISLHRCVTIGRLNTQIADSSLQKQYLKVKPLLVLGWSDKVIEWISEKETLPDSLIAALLLLLGAIDINSIAEPLPGDYILTRGGGSLTTFLQNGTYNN